MAILDRRLVEALGVRGGSCPTGYPISDAPRFRLATPTNEGRIPDQIDLEVGPRPFMNDATKANSLPGLSL